MHLPPYLKKIKNSSPENEAWVNSLPFILEKLKNKWGLKIGEPYLENVTCSYVVACSTKEKGEAVLKIGLPHEEALHEIDGLKLLNGNPTVHLFNYEKAINAMLLEKCIPGKPLKKEPELFQDKIICELLTEIWKADFGDFNFRPLASMVDLWNKETYEKLNHFPDPALAKKGCRFKEKLIETTKEEVLLATDLHAGNVLQAERRPWLAIDIKPYIGDRTYDLTQHFFNCLERLADDPKKMVKRIAKLAGVDEGRLNNWLFARLASENGGAQQKLAMKL